MTNDAEAGAYASCAAAVVLALVGLAYLIAAAIA